MTEPAAILATFSDFALVRTRKVARLIFEVPIEQAKRALDTLGMPDPAGETWCGIARIQKPGPPPALDNGPAEGGAANTGANAAPLSKPNSTRAVMMAKDPEFQKFADVTDERGAEQYIKGFCGVSSKSALNGGPGAADFDALRARFRAWRYNQPRERVG